jgi:hypothetical protein
MREVVFFPQILLRFSDSHLADAVAENLQGAAHPGTISMGNTSKNYEIPIQRRLQRQQ